MKKISKIMIYFLSLVLLVSGIYAEEENVNVLQEEHDRKIIESQDKKLTPERQDKTLKDVLQDNILAEQMQIITGDEETRYIIVAGDTVTISFKDRDSENKAAYKVSEEGAIYLPLVGQIKIADMNRKDARRTINEALMTYIRYPQAQIQVNNDGRFMVLGSVGRPGVYPLQRALTVMEAILNAKGYEVGSALNSVVVMRGPVEKPEVIRVDLRKMVLSGDRTDNIQVKPGDIVYVPISFISRIDQLVNKFYGYYLKWHGLGGQDFIEEGDPFFGPFNK